MTDTADVPQDVLGSLAREDGPVLEAIAKMHLDTLEGCKLDERSYHLVRLAALVAMNTRARKEAAAGRQIVIFPRRHPPTARRAAGL